MLSDGEIDLVFEQLGDVQVRRRFFPVGDDEVDLAVGQHAQVVGARSQVVQHHAAVGRAAPQRRHHARQELGVEVVRRRDAEGARRFLGHERRLLDEQALGLVEDALGRLEQALAMLGRHHAARAAHQQRIARQFAQLAQRRRDRGLRLVQLERHARDVFFDQQQVQDADQVQVEMLGQAGHRFSEIRGYMRQVYACAYVEYTVFFMLNKWKADYCVVIRLL
jgi:hypothetical protein